MNKFSKSWSNSMVLLLLLAVTSQAYGQQNDIIRIKIPEQYSRLFNDELVKRLVIRPEFRKSKSVFAADTILNTLEVCGGNGVYYYERSANDRASASYRVVTKVGDELQYVRNGTSKAGHEQLLADYYAGTLSSDKCVTYDSTTSLLAQVIRLVELNNRKTPVKKF
ncbi:hypothetical protein LRS06_08590 [Hymenobacter sp. J193]|uniref:hypothetical protein n=1 Tax=Hymenobacter sp. J193 TaxID=2898429 RepID=UPI002151D153|nr:hypothetical protein [Hymenobacter sp. J193]MCR5887834.1 hypothetical protein [Hymenobacter sp. J193]